MSDSRSHLHQQLSLLQQDIKNSNMLETIKSEPDYYTLHYIIDRLGVLTEDLANDHDQFTHHLCEFIATLKDIPDQSAGLLDLTTQLSSSEHAKPGLIQAYQQRAHKIYQSLQEKQSELKNYLQTLSAQPNDPLSKQCGELCTTACEEIDRYCRLGPVYLLPLQQQLQDALEKAFTQMMQENFPDYNFHPLSMLRKKDERFECDILFSTQFFASREKAEEAINNMKKQFEEIHGRNISSDSLFLITSNNNQAPFRVGINLEQYSAELGKPFLLKNLIPMAQKDFAWNFLLSKPVIHGKLGIHAVTGQSLKKGFIANRRTVLS